MALFFEEKRKADIKIDCQNFIVAPGYIDIHLNGILYNLDIRYSEYLLL